MENLLIFQPNQLSHFRLGCYRKATIRKKSHLLLPNQKAVNVKDRGTVSMEKSIAENQRVGATIDMNLIHIQGHLHRNCVKNLKNTIKQLRKSLITQLKFQAQKIVLSPTISRTQLKKTIT
jgi:hypothetical protein